MARRQTITTACDHQIPVGAALRLSDDRLVKVIASTRHTATIRDYYWWENAWARLRYWMHYGLREIHAWLEARRAVKRAKQHSSENS